MNVRITDGAYSLDNHDFTLCTADEGRTCWAAWDAYETKAHDTLNTTVSPGRLVARRCRDGRWSAPLNAAEGCVFYEPARNDAVGDELVFACRDILPEDDAVPVDSLFVQSVRSRPTCRR